MTDDEMLWEETYPEQKIPGSAEPLEGKCGARLRSKELKELGITRYCVKTQGMGTSHLGEGRCKWHGGSTPTHVKGAVQVQMKREFATLTERLGEPEPIRPPEVEAFVLAGKMKQWSLVLEEKLEELNGILEVTDKTGIEHTRALIEVLERAWERYQKSLEFLLKFDLQKRIVALEEQQANLIGSAFMAVILSRDLGLKENQIEVARTMFARSITDLGDGMTPTWASGLVIDAEVVE